MGFMNEYIQRGMSAKDYEEELLRLIQAYNKYRQTYLLVMASAQNKPIPDVALSQEDFYIVADLLSNLKTISKIDIYLETLGGSGEAAEEIVKYLRSKFEYVSFVVSGAAKSAGTIMVLSADDILMTETGSLGPIDAQVKIGRSTVSAYDYMEWVEEKQKEAQEKKRLNPFDATMVAQITPGELKGVANSLHFAEELVGQWLEKYKFKHWTETQTRKIPVTAEMKKQNAEKIAQKLINHSEWKSHGRSLKLNDLEAIGLRITEIEKDSTLKDIVYRIQTVCRMLFNSSAAYKIFATEKEKIVKLGSQVQSIPQIPQKLQKPGVVQIEQKCPQCGKDYRIYAKLTDNPRIDKDFTKQGCISFPRNNKIKCDCGYEIDMGGIRNDIEMKTGMKILD